MKSYADLSKVGLGSTKPFRAYASVLKALDYSDNDILHSYLRMKCCYICSTTQTKNQEEHKKH